MLKKTSHQRVSWLAAIVIALLAPGAALADEPASMTPFSATYTVRYGILRGTMNLALDREEDGYSYRTSLAPRGFASWLRKGEIRETTRLLDASGELQPVDYVSTDTIARPERRIHYYFDRVAGTVTGEYKSTAVDKPMRAGGHNRISAQVAIMQALQSGTRLTRIAVFDRARWKEFEFQVLPDQAVNTPAGEFETVEVRYSSPGDDKEWSLHCAPSLDYLPVMIVFSENGKVKSRAALKDYAFAEPFPLE
ncbi:MAG: DUF3108 domain-containing protein [Woeseiaceae bacterium]|nr:DUF3108 domain-containing protein [Woeseiaceae bacterium]